MVSCRKLSHIMGGVPMRRLVRMAYLKENGFGNSSATIFLQQPSCSEQKPMP